MKSGDEGDERGDGRNENRDERPLGSGGRKYQRIEEGGTRRDRKMERREREMLEKSMERLERRVEECERRERKGEEGGVLKEKVRELDRKLERKERKERKNNIVIRGLKVKEGRRRDAVEDMTKRIWVRGELVEVRRLGGERERRGGKMWS